MTTHVFFDFFGTLVEYSASRIEQGYERSFGLVQEAGASLDYAQFLSIWSEVSGQFDAAAEQSRREFSMVELGTAFFRRVLGASEETLVRDFVRTYVAEWNTGVSYPDGIAELLERLSRRFVLAVITNTHDPDLVPDHMERMGVSRFFEQVITSVEFGARKPSPRIFQHALRVCRALPEQCVYVGDDFEADYLGARSAGIRPLLIDPLWATPVPRADRLASILELEARLGDPCWGC